MLYLEIKCKDKIEITHTIIYTNIYNQKLTHKHFKYDDIDYLPGNTSQVTSKIPIISIILKHFLENSLGILALRTSVT